MLVPAWHKRAPPSIKFGLNKYLIREIIRENKKRAERNLVWGSKHLKTQLLKHSIVVSNPRGTDAYRCEKFCFMTFNPDTFMRHPISLTPLQSSIGNRDLEASGGTKLLCCRPPRFSFTQIALFSQCATPDTCSALASKRGFL